jgi:hypothetical protein
MNVLYARTLAAACATDLYIPSVMSANLYVGRVDDGRQNVLMQAALPEARTALQTALQARCRLVQADVLTVFPYGSLTTLGPRSDHRYGLARPRLQS